MVLESSFRQVTFGLHNRLYTMLHPPCVSLTLFLGLSSLIYVTKYSPDHYVTFRNRSLTTSCLTPHTTPHTETSFTCRLCTFFRSSLCMIHLDRTDHILADCMFCSHTSHKHVRTVPTGRMFAP